MIKHIHKRCKDTI